MRAVILAAGRGSRLRKLNPDGKPKCLLDVGGRTLLSRQLEMLDASGISSVEIVVGYRAQEIQNEVAKVDRRPETSLVLNSRFEQGSTISLGLADAALTSGESILLLDADVLCHPAMVERLVNSETGNCLLLDRDFEPGEEPVKIALRNGAIVEFRKQLPASLEYDTLGESVGLFRFDPETARSIAGRCLAFDQEGLANAPHEEVLRAEFLARPRDFSCEDVSGLPWIEIDFDADLLKARQEILPEIRHQNPGF